MTEPNIKNARELLQRNREVKSLTERARKLQELQRALQLSLPSMLADYCQIQRFENGVLFLDAASGAAATQLRFIQQQLVSRLKQSPAFRELDRINIRVQSTEKPSRRRKSRQANPVSAENRQLLTDTADSISDPALAESLRNLAKTLKEF